MQQLFALKGFARIYIVQAFCNTALRYFLSTDLKTETYNYSCHRTTFKEDFESLIISFRYSQSLVSNHNGILEAQLYVTFTFCYCICLLIVNK